MGLVTLLSREDEVSIAKKIEYGEQAVLKALIGTTIGVGKIIELGEKVRNEGLRTRYILRDIDEGDSTYIDEDALVKNFLKVISDISDIREETMGFREKLFTLKMPWGERRRVRRCVVRRNRKICALLKDWRLESRIINGIERSVYEQIEWFEERNKPFVAYAKKFDLTVTALRENMETKSGFLEWIKSESGLTDFIFPAQKRDKPHLPKIHFDGISHGAKIH